MKSPFASKTEEQFLESIESEIRFNVTLEKSSDKSLKDYYERNPEAKNDWKRIIFAYHTEIASIL